MKRKSTILITTLALAALLSGSYVFAQRAQGRRDFGGHHGFGMFGHLQKAKAELGLSDQQVDEIKAIVKDLREQNAPYREQLAGGIKAIATKLIANPNDISGAQSLIDQQSAAERAFKTNILNATSKALNVLTPEQRTKLSTMIAEHMAKHRGLQD